MAALILAGAAVLDLEEDWRRERDDTRGDHKVLGRTLAAAFDHTWRTAGEADAQALLVEASRGERQVQLKWVWLEPPAGVPPGPERASGLVGPLEGAREGDLRSMEVRGERPRVVSWQVLRAGGRLGAIELSESLAGRDERLWALARRALLATFVLLALFVLAAVVIGRRLVGAPIEALVAMAREVASGRLDARVEVRAPNELAVLGDEMNAMGAGLKAARAKLDEESRARLSALESLRHVDRLATVGKLAAGVAHELGTPMNVIDGRAALISSGEAVGVMATRSAQVIRDQVQNMARIIQQLLGFARRAPPMRRAEALKSIADRTLDVLAPMALQKGVRLEGRVPDGVRANVDAGGVQQVLTNLVLNGIQATPTGGVVEVTASVEHRPGGEGGPLQRWVRLDVVDSGAGLAPEARHHLFEPFFTTKEVGEGTGLGLSVSWGIVHDHGGFIEATPRAQGGTCFSVFLP